MGISYFEIVTLTTIKKQTTYYLIQTNRRQQLIVVIEVNSTFNVYKICWQGEMKIHFCVYPRK